MKVRTPRRPVFDGDVIVSYLLGWPGMQKMWENGPAAWAVGDSIRCALLVATAKATSGVILFAPADISTLTSMCQKSGVDIIGFKLTAQGAAVQAERRSATNRAALAQGKNVKGDVADPERWEAKLRAEGVSIPVVSADSFTDWAARNPAFVYETEPLIIISGSGVGKSHYVRILGGDAKETLQNHEQQIASEWEAVMEQTYGTEADHGQGDRA